MPGDPWATAQANVGLKYDPQQAAIERAIQQNQAGTAANEQALQGYGTTGRNVIGETFGTLYGLLGQNRQQQQVDLGRQVDLTQRGYDEAIGNIQGYGNTSANYLNEMARSLGQEGAGLRANTELADIVNTSLGRSSAAKANFGGNLADWAARQDVFAGQGIDQAHQSEAMRRGDFETQLLKMLGQNKLEGQLQENEWTGKLSDILGMRQNDLVAMYQQLAQQEWENAFKQAQLDQAAAEAAAQRASAYEIAAMQESGANSRASAGRDDSLDWAKFEYGKTQDQLAAQQWEKELGLKYAPEAAESDTAAYDEAMAWLAEGRKPEDLMKQRDIAQQLAAGTWRPETTNSSGGGGISFGSWPKNVLHGGATAAFGVPGNILAGIWSKWK